MAWDIVTYRFSPALAAQVDRTTGTGRAGAGTRNAAAASHFGRGFELASKLSVGAPGVEGNTRALGAVTTGGHRRAAAASD